MNFQQIFNEANRFYEGGPRQGLAKYDILKTYNDGFAIGYACQAFKRDENNKLIDKSWNYFIWSKKYETFDDAKNNIDNIAEKITFLSWCHTNWGNSHKGYNWDTDDDPHRWDDFEQFFIIDFENKKIIFPKISRNKYVENEISIDWPEDFLEADFKKKRECGKEIFSVIWDN